MEQELLYECIEDYGLKALKFGTEYEEMSFEEMSYLMDFVSGALPIYVKIGGVDARNDINTLYKMGIHCFIAPMVESAYALKNFVLTLKELCGDNYSLIKKGINIETITAYNNFETILKSPFYKELDQITLARSDFSKSIEMDVDAQKVYSMMSDMAFQLRKTGKTIIVGGGIHPKNSVEIIKKIAPDRIDTRMFIVSAKDIQKIAVGVKKCLILEKSLYLKMREIFSYREGFVETLIKRINCRLSQMPEYLTTVVAKEKAIV